MPSSQSYSGRASALSLAAILLAPLLSAPSAEARPRSYTRERPESDGCIRLPHPFAIKLYKLTRLGVRVVIAPNEPVPQEITHARLFVRKPAPPAEPIDPGTAKGIVIVTATDMTAAVANSKIG